MKLTDAFSLIRNGVSIKQYDNASGIPITRIETISNRVVDRNKCGYADIFDIEKYQDYVLQDGDILMSHINSVQHLGKTALYNKVDGEVLIHGMNLLVLRPKREILDPNYAYIALNSLKFLRQLPRITKKSVNQASFSVNDLKKVDIDVPSISKQKEITDNVMQIDRLIANRRQALSVFDELVKSRFVEMFGDPVTNPMGWETGTLADVIRTKASNGFFAKRNAYNPDGNVAVLGVVDVVNRMYSKINDLPRTDATEKDIKKYRVGYGDILFCRSSLVQAGIGKASIVPRGISDDILFECHVIRLQLDMNKCLPEFVQILVSTEYCRNQLMAVSKTATMTTIGQDGVLATKIYIPPLDLQNKFLEVVELADKSKVVVQQSIDALITLKAKLMQHYFFRVLI